MQRTDTPWDLIYVDHGNVRTMSLSVGSGEGSEMVGPFPAKDAGPKIVSALFERGLFATPKEAESAYVFRHFAYMSSGQNNAGQDYPTRLPAQSN
jgi:hypothetical protein